MVFSMKIYLIILSLIFSFQSLSKADDIRDFQIEGMSIGDSLLDFMSEAEIKQRTQITKDHYNYLKDPTKFREVIYNQIILKLMKQYHLCLTKMIKSIGFLLLEV